MPIIFPFPSNSIASIHPLFKFILDGKKLLGIFSIGKSVENAKA